jgi:hypothetical protein
VPSRCIFPRGDVEIVFSNGTAPFGNRTGHKKPDPSTNITTSVFQDGVPQSYVTGESNVL